MKKTVDQKVNERLQKAIRAVIDQQIAEADPAETVEAFERLQEEGFTSDETYSLIGQLISLEVAEEIAGKEGLNIVRYIAALDELPKPFAKPRKTVIEED